MNFLSCRTEPTLVPSLSDPRWQTVGLSGQPPESAFPIWTSFANCTPQFVRYEPGLHFILGVRWISADTANTPISVDHYTPPRGIIWAWKPQETGWVKVQHFHSPKEHLTHWLPGDVEKPADLFEPDYRFLQPGEEVQIGDEVGYPRPVGRTWTTLTGRHGKLPVTHQHAGHEYRRRVWRTLKPDELVQFGDVLTNGRDYHFPVTVDAPGIGKPASVFLDHTIRRRVDAKQTLWVVGDTTYRILGPDEVIQDGDELLFSLIKSQWIPCISTIGATARAYADNVFRRPIRKAAQPQSQPAAQASSCPASQTENQPTSQPQSQPTAEAPGCPATFVLGPSTVGKVPTTSSASNSTAVYWYENGKVYQKLGDNEVIRAGDQVRNNGGEKWIDCIVSVGSTPAKAGYESGAVFRRLISTGTVEASSVTVAPAPAPAPAPDVGLGYRPLKDDEIIQAGDEWTSSLTWKTVDRSVGRKPGDYGSIRFRRKVEPAKIDPGAGFRLLGPTEVIQKGDQLWTSGGHWLDTLAAGDTPQKGLVYRRKVELKIAGVSFESAKLVSSLQGKIDRQTTAIRKLENQRNFEVIRREAFEKELAKVRQELSAERAKVRELQERVKNQATEIFILTAGKCALTAAKCGAEAKIQERDTEIKRLNGVATELRDANEKVTHQANQVLELTSGKLAAEERVYGLKVENARLRVNAHDLESKNNNLEARLAVVDAVRVDQARKITDLEKRLSEVNSQVVETYFSFLTARQIAQAHTS